MKKPLIGSAVIIAFSIVVAFSAVTVADASHSWGTYHWARQANPFTLQLADNVTSAWDAYLAEASSDWSASTVLDTTIVPGTSNPRTCKAVTGTIQVCNAKYGNNGWLGLASISINSAGHITRGTAKMNDTYFASGSYNTPAWRRLVMCQEVAHDFGLDHQDEGFGAPNLGSCMDYTNDPDGGGAYGPSNEHPNAHDFAQLESIYAHLDSSTTISQVITNASGPARAIVRQDRADHEEFGTPVGTDARGRANVFSRRDGNETVMTHVFWLPE